MRGDDVLPNGITVVAGVAYKKCSQCCELKAWDDFYSNGRIRIDGSSGRQSRCKSCLKQRGERLRVPHSEHNTRKRCLRCLIEKSVDDFPMRMGRPRADGTSAHGDFCQDCRKHKKYERQKSYSHASRKGYRLKYDYGISIDTFHSMLSRQGGKCAICSLTLGAELGDARRTHVDHDHKTGQVRGLLCQKCNMGLGCFVDNKDYLTNALLYLEQFTPHTRWESVVG